MAIQTFVFHTKTRFITVNYLIHQYFPKIIKNSDLPKMKFELIVSQLLKCLY